jgi:hypothetical protein
MFFFSFVSGLWIYGIVDIIKKRKAKETYRKPLLEDLLRLTILFSLLPLWINTVLDSILQVFYGQSKFALHIAPISASIFLALLALIENNKRKEWASKLKSNDIKIDKSKVKRHILRLWFRFIFLIILTAVAAAFTLYSMLQ